jgi:hypothetical protein
MVIMPQASTRTPAQPQAQQAPQAPRAPSVIVAGRPGAPAIPIPLNAAEVAALRDRVEELRGQRSSVNSQRASLARELRSARPGPDATGLETHMAQLDARLLTIESDIADIGKAISAAPNGLPQTTTSTAPAARYGPFSASQLTGISIVGIVFVAGPLVWAMAMIAMRRAARPPAPQLPKEVAERLERMEQGIEAVAIEIERIGEGQRFVTQLMGDRAQRAALPEGVPRA